MLTTLTANADQAGATLPLTPSAERLVRVVEGLPAPLAVCVLRMPFDPAAPLDAVNQAGQRLAGD